MKTQIGTGFKGNTKDYHLTYDTCNQKVNDTDNLTAFLMTSQSRLPAENFNFKTII